MKIKYFILQIKVLLIRLKRRRNTVFYIGGSQALPSPLTPGEEMRYLEMLGGTQDTEAKKVLIERNLRLVVYIARKFENTGVNVEDLISIGAIGLIKAINTFKTDKKIKLATYASRCIENEILMYLRSFRKLANEVFLQDPIGVDADGNEVTIEDKLAGEGYSIDDQVNLKMRIKLLYGALAAVLSQRERVIVELRYGLTAGEEETQREIAERLGISRSYVSRIEKRALKKMEKEITRLENGGLSAT